MMNKKIIFPVLAVVVVALCFTGCGNNDNKQIKNTLSQYLTAIQDNNYEKASSYFSQSSMDNLNKQLLKQHWDLVQNNFQIKQFEITDRIKVFDDKFAVAIVERKELNKITNKDQEITSDYFLFKENDEWKIIRINEIFYTIQRALNDNKIYIARDLAEKTVELSPYTLYGYYNLAKIYSKEKRYSDVSETVNKAVEKGNILLNNNLIARPGEFHELVGEMYILDLKLNSANEQFEKAFEEYRKKKETALMNRVKDRMVYVNSIKYLNREK